MSDLLKGQVEIDDLVKRYETLRGEIEQRLEGVDGAGDAEQIERLRTEIHAHGEFVKRTLDGMDKRQRREIGDSAEFVTYEYDERGDYCDESDESGTIVGIDGDKVVIQVAEQVIPAKNIPAHTVKATWNECVKQWVNEKSYPFWHDYV